jgi:hypothetical protein
MTNPKYQVNIYYVPMYKSGVTSTPGVDLYSGGYFQANMPEIKIYATGSSHTTALAALMLIATASTTYDNGLPPL